MARRLARQEEGGEVGNVGAPMAERRQFDDPRRDAMVQVGAEAPVGEHRPEVAIGRGDDTDARGARLPAAEPVDDAFLEDTEDAGLRLRGHVADLVEEQRAAVGQLELAGPRVHSGGDAALDAEQLHLEEVAWEGGAVERDEGPSARGEAAWR